MNKQIRKGTAQNSNKKMKKVPDDILSESVHEDTNFKRERKYSYNMSQRIEPESPCSPNDKRSSSPKDFSSPARVDPFKSMN